MWQEHVLKEVNTSLNKKNTFTKVCAYIHTCKIDKPCYKWGKLTRGKILTTTTTQKLQTPSFGEGKNTCLLQSVHQNGRPNLSVDRTSGPPKSYQMDL